LTIELSEKATKVCMVSFLPKLIYTKKGSHNDNRTLVWKSMYISMREHHESLGETINYYVGASCCFGQYCQGLFFVVFQTTSKFVFSDDSFKFEQICPQFSLLDILFGCSFV
jgi:hypothetical protein